MNDQPQPQRGGPRKGAGRKPHADPHTATIAIACSAGEKARWQALAKNARLSVSEWVRRHLP